MKIDGNYTFAAPRERVYEMLRDPQLLKDCIPGCESLVLEPDGRYLATIKAGIAAVRGTFVGHVQITDEKAGQGYRLLVDGSGGPGFVKGDAEISLADEGSGTQVSVSGDGQVGGMIAGVGQRILLPTARMMMNQFFGCMKSKIEAVGQ